MNSVKWTMVKICVILLFIAGTSIFVSLRVPYYLVAFLPTFIFAYIPAKSTVVNLDLMNGPGSRAVKLSYQQFDEWARRLERIGMDQSIYSSSQYHWTEKMSLLGEVSKASRYRSEPARSQFILSLIAIFLGFLTFPSTIQASLLNAFATLGGETYYYILLGLLLGYFAGDATGGFYRWIRARM